MYNIFYEHIIVIPAIAFILSVIFKWFYSIFKKWKFDMNIALWSGWMPSSHSAVVVSLATAIALKNGVWSDLFAIAIVFTVIILYDAINVRFEAWLHAVALNKYIWEKKLRESLWHLPSEAFAWSFLWILTSVALFYV